MKQSVEILEFFATHILRENNICGLLEASNWFHVNSKWQKIPEISTVCEAQCGNWRNSLTLFSQKFRESIGFTKEITK